MTSSGYAKKRERSRSPPSNMQNLKNSIKMVGSPSASESSIAHLKLQNQFAIQASKIAKIETEQHNTQLIVNSLNQAFLLQQKFTDEWENQLEDIHIKNRLSIKSMVKQLEDKLNRQIDFKM